MPAVATAFGDAHAAVTARRLATFLMTEEADPLFGFVDKELIIEI